ncbi:Hsp20/alpha crystallin family protein [Cupriavidus sp. SW-Y-13]|uniref:Hsp20/alpha crystallin family protein n=1 Tax=Cupriavidus sp. SW-Y-13 TaxID=2653854 RepID=UPI001365EB37|nr:Hsp20/alpha crystallin family protein [Cupriavidus sp. SW-Y-13]MWL91182.1 Hsp20 family protein [Cupriavidus sp. SW-Y-13]
MTSLRHYDPLSIEPISDMMQGMLRAFRGTADTGMVFKVDVTESDSSYTVTAELPGVKPQDIDVNVDRGTVMIAAKLDRMTEQRDGERVIRHERYSGAMRRAFTLDADIDESKVDATYADGVLRLVLPKKEATPQKRIQIRSAEEATR